MLRLNTHLFDSEGSCFLLKWVYEIHTSLEASAGGVTAVLSAPFRLCLLTMAKTQLAVTGMLDGIRSLAGRERETREDNHRSVPLLERLHVAKERALEQIAIKNQPERIRNMNHALE